MADRAVSRHAAKLPRETAALELAMAEFTNVFAPIADKYLGRRPAGEQASH